jgi:RNA polymerase sigma-70 factor, ECF subfamily
LNDLSFQDPVNTLRIVSVLLPGTMLREELALQNVPGQSLGELVEDAVSGNTDAFHLLYRRFSAAVHGVLLARVPPQDAEDLVQEVFLEGWQKLSGLREPNAFGGWICTIARRKGLDWLRARPPAVPLPADLPGSERPGASAEARLALEALARLPEAYRETLALRLVEGLSGPEIAVVTGLTPGSVRVNLHRGLRMLREELGVADAER